MRPETPNHALQRTAPCVTAPASAAALPPTMQVPRRTPRSLSLGSLGDFAHLSRAMSTSEDNPSSMGPTKLHALKTSSYESIASPTVWSSVASRPFCGPAFPESARRESPPSSTALLLGIYREAVASRRSTRSSSERLDSAAVFGFAPSRAFTESQLSRRSRLGVHRESGRLSRNSFRASVLNPMKSPNHALQRTAPRVTARAFCERSGIYICGISVRSTVGHAPRHAPPSLSLGSLAVLARVEK